MNKKIIGIIVVSLIVLTLPLALYRYFKPKDANPLQLSQIINDTIQYNEFIDNTKDFSGEHLFLVTSNKEDSDYIESALVRSLIQENEKDNFVLPLEKLETGNAKDLTVTQLKDKLHIENSPAFVYLFVDDKGTIDIKSTFEYYESNPFTKEELKQWLYANDLWVGPMPDEN